MQNETCLEKHKRIDERLDIHDKRLDKHGERLDKLDRSDAKKEEAISNLCRQLSGQTKAIWGLVTAILTMLAGFFIYAIQQDIF